MTDRYVIIWEDGVLSPDGLEVYTLKTAQHLIEVFTRYKGRILHADAPEVVTRRTLEAL